MHTKFIHKKGKHTHIINFDLEETINVPEFETYFRLRENNPKIDYSRWRSKFGKDLCLHFEIAYSLLKDDEL